MRFFIIGSGRHLDLTQKEGFTRACEDLGRVLAQQEHEILICSESVNTADPHVVGGANSLGDKKLAKVMMYHPSGMSPLHNSDAFKNIVLTKKPSEGGWEIAHFTAINDADIVLAIGGGDGSSQASIAQTY